jgi:hypothetical protein
MTMKITTKQINDIELKKYALRTIRLIEEEKYEALADEYGYTLSFNENPAEVIKKEISQCLEQAGNTATLVPIQNPDVIVKYFEPNDIPLIAVVDYSLAIENGTGSVLVELVVSGKEENCNISVEQISYVFA